MSGEQYAHHREAALALLGQCPDLPRKEAAFLGHVCITPELSGKQRNWLGDILDNNGFAPLAD